MRLLSRHWIITDGNDHVEEVRGKGVVGEQPHLKPGESFRYTSGTMIGTPVGSEMPEHRHRCAAEDVRCTGPPWPEHLF